MRERKCLGGVADKGQLVLEADSLRHNGEFCPGARRGCVGEGEVFTIEGVFTIIIVRPP